MKGKTIFITGATSGIGKETAGALAEKGATIVFTTRDREKGKLVQQELINRSNNKDIHVLFCDLASFESIRNCCKEFQNNFDKLHVLINNAGIGNHTRRESKNGIEQTFATNHLAPFLMTSLLLGVLKKSAPSRIINLTSGLHYGTMNFDDIELKHNYRWVKAYKQSKLCNILFTRLLAAKLKGTGVTVNCANPGMTKTNLARDSNRFSRAIFNLLSKPVEKGAATSIYLATSPEVENVTGEYFSKSQISKSSKESHDLALAKRLWTLSEEYVGSKFKI
jgi:NAD(P)-dependent dehydrogenase (short-subunit alcohol dehydrogenase family)